MKNLITSLLLISSMSLSIEKAISCSMFKITSKGKTMVGNNEDYWNPNTRLWFEKEKAHKYGVAYVGFDNLFPQGGMNEAGLVFDGFSVSRRSVKPRIGKKLGDQNTMKNVMQNCKSINEVYDMLDQYDLGKIMNGGMLLFVDNAGTYLVVEVDTLIKGNDPKYILSNFCPSNTPDLNKVDIPFFQQGKKLLEKSNEASLSFSASMMDTMHQNWGDNKLGGTLYSTIYDLKEKTINLYFYHDYSKSVTFSLKEEFKKGNRVINIPDLFPENEHGQNYLNNWSNASTQIELFKNMFYASDTIKLKNIVDSISAFIPYFEREINAIGYKWMTDKEFESAINIFSVNVKFCPWSSNVFDSLGEAYMANKQYELALVNYTKSVEMDPNNQYGKTAIKKLNTLLNLDK